MLSGPIHSGSRLSRTRRRLLARPAASPTAPRLWCEIAAVLRERFRVHPLELVDVVIAASRTGGTFNRCGFGGFCSDTFAFLGEIGEAESKDWMADRPRALPVRAPRAARGAVRAVAERYVRPVLNREYGWDLECDARPAGRSRASARTTSAAAGRTSRCSGSRSTAAAERTSGPTRSSSCGSPPTACATASTSAARRREAGRQFRRNVQEHGEAIFAPRRRRVLRRVPLLGRRRSRRPRSR